MDNYRSINLTEWTLVGEGGNGKTYINPSLPDHILKVNKTGLNTLEVVRHEYEVSKAVDSLGLQVPKVYEIVSVGDNYGTLSQLIKDKKSLSRLCHDQPERTAEIARIFCDKAKDFLTTPCNTECFPSRKEQVLWAIDHCKFISNKNRQIVRAFAETVPEANTCLHGDFQPGNIIQAGNQFYWIDLDRFAYGNPMFDIGHLYQICQVYAPMKQVQDIFHMTLEQFHVFWDQFAKVYTGLDDHSDFDKIAGKYACLDVIVRERFNPSSFAERLFFRGIVKRLVKQFYS